jgi:1-aminocyclopropane-1-carboxylate deaminase
MVGDLLSVNLLLPSPVSELHDDRLTASGVRVLLKRDDLIHPEIPGNKWRKLKYNISSARKLGFTTLLTFGGAYSNHIRATAAVGYFGGFDTIGVIRGEKHLPLNSSLAYAVARGMRLTYLDRTTYRTKTSDAVISGLHREFGDFYLLPEGGSNKEAVLGCAELQRQHVELARRRCGTRVGWKPRRCRPIGVPRGHWRR